MSNNMIAERQKIIKSFTNGFAQQVYELEDGTKLYINYSQDEIEIERPAKELQIAEKQNRKKRFDDIDGLLPEFW